MRVSKDENEDRIFSRDEWLSKSQIKGFFSRLTKLRRKEGNVCSENLDSDLQELDLDGEDVDDTDVDEEIREELIEKVVDGLSVQHPIYYDMFDLCELYQLKNRGEMSFVGIRDRKVGIRDHDAGIRITEKRWDHRYQINVRV